MTPPLESPGTAAASNLEAVLPGLNLKPRQLDDRARQQAALLAFGRRSSVQPPIAVLMEDAAAMVAEIVRADHIGVGEVGGDGKTVSLRVAALGKQGVLSHVGTHEYPIDPTQSIAGYALHVATPASSDDLSADNRCSDRFLRKLGMVSALTVPLHVNGRPFGVLGAYSGKAGRFDLDDVQFAETIAHLLTSSLARIRAEEELHKERSFASAVLNLIDTLVMTLDEQGYVVGMNRASQQVTGFSIEEIRQRPFWNIFVLPEQLDLVRSIFRGSAAGTAPCEFEGYLVTKDGTRKRVSWSMKRMSDGKVQSIILSGVDKTEKLQTEAELQEAKAVAEGATKKLQELCAMTAVEKPTTMAELPSPDATTGADDSGDGHQESSRPFQPLGGRSGAEQRGSQRRTFRYEQRIAPCLGGEMPGPEQFFGVCCHDISASGLSFLLDRAPDFEKIVVALGQEPKVSYFTAQVVRVASLDKTGGKSYLVGCRFTARVRL